MMGGAKAHYEGDVTVAIDITAFLLTPYCNDYINGGAIIDHEAPRERCFVAVEK
jgi:hypothetical protein